MHGGMRLWWYEGAPRDVEKGGPTSTRPPTNDAHRAFSVDKRRMRPRIVWRMRRKPLAIDRGAGCTTSTH
jgi:hypothetical protein